VLVADAPAVVEDDEAVGEAAGEADDFEWLHPASVKPRTAKPTDAIRRVFMLRAPFIRANSGLPRQRLHRQFPALFQGCGAPPSSRYGPTRFRNRRRRIPAPAIRRFGSTTGRARRVEDPRGYGISVTGSHREEDNSARAHDVMQVAKQREMVGAMVKALEEDRRVVGLRCGERQHVALNEGEVGRDRTPLAYERAELLADLDRG